MRWRPRAFTAPFALACACGLACGGGGGDNTIVTTTPAFPQAFLPPVLPGGSGGSGDVTIRVEGDLFAVTGTSDVTRVSRVDGSVTTFAVGGAANPALLSIFPGFGTDPRLFAGDDAGRIWEISGDGSSSELFVDTGSDPITGLTFAPDGYGGFGGSLFAAAGASGVLRITTDDPPTVTPFANPGDRYVDLAFAGTTLLAIDATHAELDIVNTDGTVTSFQGGFITPVGIGSDGGAGEIYVADAGDATHDGVLYTVPVAGGTPTKRAAYHFDPDAPSGIGFDQIGTIAFIATSPRAIRGAQLSRVDPANPNFGLIIGGPSVGYGDLEFDRLGGFILVANDPGTGGTVDSNFLFSIPRDGSSVTSLGSAIGSPLEDLLGVAVDSKHPAATTGVDEVIYVSTGSGNIYQRAADGTVSLLVSVSASAVLGLELAPSGFGSFGGDLIATTADGRVFAIDPVSPNPPAEIVLNQSVSRLSDLVFSSEGTLYAVDNGTSTSRILRIAPNGAVTNLAANTTQLGQPDGIEIDEGADRLLVTSRTSGGDKLLAVDLGSIPAAVTALANVSIDDGFSPTGVVYDRLGTAVLRQGNDSSSLRAFSVAP